MANTVQLKKDGQIVYPITDRSCIIGLEEGPVMSCRYAWDGTTTPDVTKIPAGVTVEYNSNTYTGTLAASASTVGYQYLVYNPTSTEFDRYATDATGGSYAWKAMGDTTIQSPDIADNLTTNDSTKALSAKQGKILNEELEGLEAKVTESSFVNKSSQFVIAKYIQTNLSIGATVDVDHPASLAGYCYLVLPVVSGLKVKVKGQGASAPRLWAFTDSSYKLLSVASANTGFPVLTELTAAQDGYCIVNCTIASSPEVQLEVRTSLKNTVAAQGVRISDLESKSETDYNDIRDQDQEIFLLNWEDTLSWKSKTVSIVPGGVSIVLPYLGKTECEFTVDSSVDENYFVLQAKNKSTGNWVDLVRYGNTKASFPLTLNNPQPNTEFTEVRLYLLSTSTAAKMSLSIVKPNIIAPVIKAAYANKFLFDCPLPNYKTTSKFSASDYSVMRTAEIYAAYDALVSAYPDYVTRTELGEVESRAIGDIPAETNKMYRYDFTPSYPRAASPQIDVPKIKVMMLSGTHPEWASIAALYRMMQSLCASWQNNDALEALRFNVHFIIIPAASPWALNHNSRGNANGVDMARNFPAGWQQGTYIQPPANTTYGGTEPLSETEAQLIWGVFNAEKKGMVAAIDYHSNVSTTDFFWCPNNPGDAFMATVSMNFIKMVVRQLYGKYPGLTPSTMIGYYDSTNPGGSFSYNATVNGVEGLSFECSHTVFDWMEDTGDVLTVAHDGIINFLIVLLRGLLGRQYSTLISPLS